MKRRKKFFNDNALMLMLQYSVGYMNKNDVFNLYASVRLLGHFLCFSYNFIELIVIIDFRGKIRAFRHILKTECRQLDFWDIFIYADE